MLCKICVKRAISGCLPGTRFLLAAKERTKENCRCFDAVRGCARGATVERSETGERTMIAPAGQSTARACLRSKLAALVVRRQAPPNPRRGKRQLCRGGIYAARSLPRQPVNGKGGGLPPSLAPLVRKFSQQSVGAGHARPAALLCHPFAFCLVGRGLDPSAAFRRRPVTALPPNPLLTPHS